MKPLEQYPHLGAAANKLQSWFWAEHSGIVFFQMNLLQNLLQNGMEATYGNPQSDAACPNFHIWSCNV